MARRINTFTAFDGVAMFDLCVENIANFVADQIVNGLNCEMRGKPLLNTVNDCQLRLALGKFLLEFRAVIWGQYLFPQPREIDLLNGCSG